MMNRYRLFLLVLILASFSALTANTITVSIEVPCPEVETVFLYRFGGLHFDKAHQTGVKAGKAVFTLPEQDWQFYYLGADTKDVLPVILGKEKEIHIKVVCTSFAGSEIVDSPIHKEYLSLKSSMNGLKNQGTQLTKKHMTQLAQGQTPEAFVDEMGRIDQRKLTFLEETTRQNAFFGQIVSLNTYLSYFVQPQDYSSELEYFVGEYFRFVNWNDKGLEHQPWVFEAFKAFSGALADTKMDAANLTPYIQQALDKVPKESRTYIIALSGIITGLEKPNAEAFVHFAEQYIAKYGKTQPVEAKSLKERMTQQSLLMPGSEAPDFSQNSPEGNPITLSSLRGKIVLIDFWASWCGPCRRDNPKVVQLYEQYKDQGFDILGVSLDSDRQRWLDAIAKDGLVWNQVSDLQGWRNAAGQLYQVTSIPHTVLLDREGNIIARGLRGPALEQKLASLFNP